MIDLGDTYTSSVEVYDKPPASGGVLIAPGTCTLTVTLPDGSVVAGTTPTVTATGKYKFDYVTTVAGRITFRWLTTSPSTAYTDEISVAPADPGFIVSLAEAKAHLGKTNTIDDEELRSVIASATTNIEARIGPVVRRSITERVRLGFGDRRFVLGQAPVISLTSMVGVTSNLVPIDVSLLTVDPDTGAVIYTDLWRYFWGGWYTVVYAAGRPVIEAGIVAAALSFIRGEWETQRGVAGLPLKSAGEESFLRGGAAPVLWRLDEALKPFLRLPGVA